MDSRELKLGDLCEKGHQLRPNIVWFGEAVPMMEEAADVVEQADILVIVGTSLVVYPAASLVHYVSNNVPIFIVDPHQPEISRRSNHHFIQEKATTGMAQLKEILLKDYT